MAKARASSLFDPKIIVPAFGAAFTKLDPHTHDQESGHVRRRGRGGF